MFIWYYLSFVCSSKALEMHDTIGPCCVICWSDLHYMKLIRFHFNPHFRPHVFVLFASSIFFSPMLSSEKSYQNQHFHFLYTVNFIYSHNLHWRHDRAVCSSIAKILFFMEGDMVEQRVALPPLSFGCILSVDYCLCRNRCSTHACVSFIWVLIYQKHAGCWIG